MSKHLYIVETERVNLQYAEFDRDKGIWIGPADVEEEVFRIESETPAEAIQFAEAFKLEPNQIIAVRHVADLFNWDSNDAWKKNVDPEYENVYWRQWEPDMSGFHPYFHGMLCQIYALYCQLDAAGEIDTPEDEDEMAATSYAILQMIGSTADPYGVLVTHDGVDEFAAKELKRRFPKKRKEASI